MIQRHFSIKGSIQQRLIIGYIYASFLTEIYQMLFINAYICQKNILSIIYYVERRSRDKYAGTFRLLSVDQFLSHTA